MLATVPALSPLPRRHYADVRNDFFELDIDTLGWTETSEQVPCRACDANLIRNKFSQNRGCVNRRLKGNYPALDMHIVLFSSYFLFTDTSR